MEYDCIVVGAGNGGLVAALTLQKKGKKVLLLEKGKVPGGLATSFKRGNFEFEATLQDFYGLGDNENIGDVGSLLERLGLSSKIALKTIEESIHIICKNKKEEYILPSGVDNFIEQMEKYVPNSKDSLTSLFGICEDVKDGLTYLKEQKENLELEDFYQKYPNFIQIAPCNAKTILEKLECPRKTIEILSIYCFYLGSTISDLSFLHFALLIDAAIRLKTSIPVFTSHELSTTLETEFKNLGGVVKYFSKVDEIVVSNNEVEGVKVKEDFYPSKHIIANISPINAYAMIKKEDIPKEALKLQNKRTLSQKSICVYLGLNKTAEELGLTSYHYYIVNSLELDQEIKNMDQMLNGNLSVTILNNGVSSASKEGTCIILLKGMFYGSDFEKNINKDNYFEYKEKIAKEYIRILEESTGTSITEAIEEIEVATPVTFARYTGHPDGVSYGFQAKGYDNLLSRMACEEKENFIKGLRFCGGFGSNLSGYGATYLNGEEVALKTLEECEQ